MLQFTFGLPAPTPRKSVLCCEQVNIVGNDLRSQVHGENQTGGAHQFPLFAQITAAIKAGGGTPCSVRILCPEA